MYNRIVLVGRLVNDIEVNYTINQVARGTFTLAVSRPFSAQENEQNTDFIDCIIWRKQAENMKEYTAKGSVVLVEGRLQIRNYVDNNGNKRSKTEVICDNCTFLSGKKNTEDNQSINNVNPSLFDKNNKQETSFSYPSFNDLKDEEEDNDCLEDSLTQVDQPF